MSSESDSKNVNDQHIAAVDICKRRLEKKERPLSRSTRNRSAIRPEDECLINLGGTGSGAQHAIAVASIEVLLETNGKATIDSQGVLTELPQQVIEFFAGASAEWSGGVEAVAKRFGVCPRR